MQKNWNRVYISPFKKIFGLKCCSLWLSNGLVGSRQCSSKFGGRVGPSSFPPQGTENCAPESSDISIYIPHSLVFRTGGWRDFRWTLSAAHAVGSDFQAPAPARGKLSASTAITSQLLTWVVLSPKRKRSGFPGEGAGYNLWPSQMLLLCENISLRSLHESKVLCQKQEGIWPEQKTTMPNAWSLIFLISWKYHSCTASAAT